ncbi:MAG: FHA domain-containing protein [Bdellovibrionales bacterium]|nr:FHA domain-containing protein [Bdellovibrionales bacterium]
MGSAVRYKHTDVPRQPGEMARFKVVQGPDQGAVYVLTGPKATVGRGESNDLVVSDLKASRLHAEISQVGPDWVVKDLGSVNGILYNGKASKSATLRMGDTFTLGETTLEFMSAEAGTMMLRAPAKSVVQVRENLQAVEGQKERVRKMTTFGGLKEFAAGLGGGDTGAMGQEQKKKLMIRVVAGLVIAWFLMDEMFPSAPQKPEGRKPAAISANKEAEDLGKYLPKPDSPEINRAADMFFKQGFREFREKNYLRAKANFENVLRVDPGHRLARLYLQNSTMAIAEDTKSLLEQGKRSMTSGKYRDAKGAFESVLRLLYYDQSNPAYEEAKEQLQKVKDKMAGAEATS